MGRLVGEGEGLEVRIRDWKRNEKSEGVALSLKKHGILKIRKIAIRGGVRLIPAYTLVFFILCVII